jgi:gas vesicle protein
VGERADYLGGTDASSDPSAIAGEIEQTRTEMSSTIEAIQDRLDPERLTDQAVGAATEVTEQARDAAKEVAEFAIGEAKAAVRELAEQARTAVREATVGRVEQVAANTRDTAQYVATNTRDTAQHVRADLLTTVKQNPIPAALAAIGLSWLWTHRAGASGSGTTTGRAPATAPTNSTASPPAASPASGALGPTTRPTGGSRAGTRLRAVSRSARRRPSGGASQQTAGQAVGQVQSVAGQAVDQVQGVAGQAVGQVQDIAGQAQQVAGQVVGQVQDTAGQVGHQAKGAFWQLLDSNPMAVGALGAVVGGVTALLLPETEKENRIMGEARDRVMDRVQEVAGEAVDKVQHVAEEVGETAVKEAKYQGLTQDAGTGRRVAPVVPFRPIRSVPGAAPIPSRGSGPRFVHADDLFAWSRPAATPERLDTAGLAALRRTSPQLSGCPGFVNRAARRSPDRRRGANERGVRLPGCHRDSLTRRLPCGTIASCD